MAAFGAGVATLPYRGVLDRLRGEPGSAVVLTIVDSAAALKSGQKPETMSVQRCFTLGSPRRPFVSSVPPSPLFGPTAPIVATAPGLELASKQEDVAPQPHSSAAMHTRATASLQRAQHKCRATGAATCSGCDHLPPTRSTKPYRRSLTGASHDALDAPRAHADTCGHMQPVSTRPATRGSSTPDLAATPPTRCRSTLLSAVPAATAATKAPSAGRDEKPPQPSAQTATKAPSQGDGVFATPNLPLRTLRIPRSLSKRIRSRSPTLFFDAAQPHPRADKRQAVTRQAPKAPNLNASVLQLRQKVSLETKAPNAPHSPQILRSASASWIEL